MSEEPAYRALRSKASGSYDEYDIIAASREPMSPRGYLQLLRIIVVDNPPNTSDGPHSLPWITFAGFGVRDDRQFQGVAVTDWSGNADAGGRPIMQTAFYCVPDGPDVRNAGLTGMAEVVRQAPTDWTHPDPLDLEPGKATLHPRDVGHQAADVEAFGVERIAAAAGMLLAGHRVVMELRAGALDLAARIGVLDAVVSLLPAGARSWLYSATWSSFDEGTGVQLAFGIPRTDAYLMRWTSLETPSSEAEIYRQAIQRLAVRYGLARVISELASAHEQTDRSVEAGLIALRSLDAAGHVLRRLRAGDVDLVAARQVIASGDAGELPTPERRDFLFLLVSALRPNELELVEPLWTEDTFSILARLTQKRLWHSNWSFEDLYQLFDLAQRRWDYRRGDFFTEVLATPADARLDRRRRAATVLVDRAPDPGEPWLAALFAAERYLAVDAAILQLYASRSSVAGRWIDVITRATTRDGRPPMAVLTVLSFVFGNTESAPSVEDFAKLAESDPSAAGAFTVEICRRHAPRNVEAFLDGVVVPWLHRSISQLSQSHLDLWRTALAERRSEMRTTRDLALLDLVRLRLDGNPPSFSERVGKLEDRNLNGYTAALGELLDEVPGERLTVVTRVLGQMTPGWSRDQRVAGRVLEALRVLPPDLRANPNPPELELVLTMLVDEDDRFHQLHRAREFSFWKRELDRRPHLRLRGLTERFRQVTPGMPLEQVDQLVAEILRAGMPGDQVIQGLRDRRIDNFGERLPERLGLLLETHVSETGQQVVIAFYAWVLGGDAFRVTPTDAVPKIASLGSQHLRQGAALLEIASFEAGQLFAAEDVEALRETIQITQASLERAAGRLTPRGRFARTFDIFSGRGRG